MKHLHLSKKFFNIIFNTEEARILFAATGDLAVDNHNRTLLAQDETANTKNVIFGYEI